MVTKDEVLAFLRRKYVQHADARQKKMGLVYTTAETNDLAEELTKFFNQREGKCGKETESPLVGYIHKCIKPKGHDGHHVYGDAIRKDLKNPQ